MAALRRRRRHPTPSAGWGRSRRPSCRAASCFRRCTETHWEDADTQKRTFSSGTRGEFDRAVLSVGLLVEEGEKVAHHDEERPREGGNDRFDLSGFFRLLLDF